MKNQYILFQRSGIFYCEDTATGKQKSLRTRDRAEAERLLAARNEAARQPAMNLQIAQVYLQHGDPQMATRTWQQVMEQMAAIRQGATQARWLRAIKNRPLDLIRSRKLIETTADDFVTVLNAGGVATNMYLRRIHHYAMTMHWLPWPVLPKRHWPPIRYGVKRAITAGEHQLIIQRETNPAKRAYYQLLWHLGGAQTDMARLKAEDVDWTNRGITYQRCKTGTMSVISFGAEVAEILKTLPASGLRFPTLAHLSITVRAGYFRRRLKSAGISGVTLHSYRYSWAERAKAAGYPERFAMQALGHASKLVHRAYAKQAQVIVPPLENYEARRDSGAVVAAALPVASRN